MQDKKFMVMVLFFLFFISTVSANEEISVTCTTSQEYTWPVKDPSGTSVTFVTEVSHTVRTGIGISIDQAYGMAGMASWKKCRGEMLQKFDTHWKTFEHKMAPAPSNWLELMLPITKHLCENYLSNPELYKCIEE